jgi:hypothetical protein
MKGKRQAQYMHKNGYKLLKCYNKGKFTIENQKIWAIKIPHYPLQILTHGQTL